MAKLSGPTITRVAVVGTGVISRSWAKVYAVAGCSVLLYDSQAAQVDKALAWLKADFEADRAKGRIGAKGAGESLARISVARGLAEAVSNVGYVQESGPEILQIKQALYKELDSVAPPGVIIGSSTSGFDMTAIAEGMKTRGRCVVAHPVNPPHVVPGVEVVPGQDTDPEVLARTKEFMLSIGRRPIMMHRYAPGFILNRLQAALLREAINIVDQGIADVDAVDASISEGLGLRWAFMGPFGTANTNADGGVREYFTRYGDFYINLMNDLFPTPSFSPEQIERMGQGTDEMVHHVDRARMRAWRDELLRDIVEVKKRHPFPE